MARILGRVRKCNTSYSDKLSEVDKFAYLRGLLEEPARSTVAGFALTVDNYNDTIELLKRRLGRDEKIRRAHINELLNLKPVFKVPMKQIFLLHYVKELLKL